MQADICQLGLDQRKVNVLAREYCDQCKPKRKLKPVILSHEMMPGLLQVCWLYCLLMQLSKPQYNNTLERQPNSCMVVIAAALCSRAMCVRNAQQNSRTTIVCIIGISLRICEQPRV